MKRIKMVVNWKNMEALLRQYCRVGQSRQGANAYPPVMFLKALLLKRWFYIPTDPGLDNQINDRISFKKLLGLPFDKPSPDHAIFSRFRSRLSQEALMKLNNEVLQAFATRGGRGCMKVEQWMFC